MADLLKNKPIAPPQPEQPLFNLNDIINAPSLTDAATIHANAVTTLNKQKTTLDIDSMVQKADLLQTTSRQAQEIFKNNETQTRALQAAQQRRGQIEKIPPLVGKILGLFDKDYDWGYWNEQVRSSKLQLAANSDQLSQIQMLSQLQESVLNNQIAMINSQYQNLTTTFDQAFSVRKIIADEEQRSFQNRLQLNQEARSAAIFEMEKTRFSQEQELQSVSRLTDEDLQLASEGKLPGVNSALADKEMLIRNSNRTALNNALLAQQKGNLELSQQYRADFMSRQSANDLTTLAQKAKDEGGKVNIGGVEFTQTELSRAAVNAISEDKKVQDAVADQMLTIASMEPNVNEIMNMSLRITTATGVPGIHPDAQRIVNKATTEIQTMIDNGNYLKAGELSEKYLAEIDALGDKVVKAFPAKQQPFVMDQFDGRISSPQNVSDFIGDMIFNPEAMNNALDAKLATEFRIVAEEAKKIQSTSLSFGQVGADGSITLPSEISNRGQIIQTAFGNVGEQVRASFIGKRNYSAYKMAFSDLSKQVPWLRGITSLEQFTDQATGQLDPGRLYTFLRDKYIADVEAGLVPVAGSIDSLAVRPYDKQFIDYMKRPEFQLKLAQQWTDYTLQGRAVFQQITGGDPLIEYMDKLIKDEQKFETNYVENKEAVNQMISPSLAQFRMRYSPLIDRRTNELVQQNPNMSRAEAKKQAENEIYLQAQQNNLRNMPQ